MKKRDTSKATFKVVLDLGKGDLGDHQDPDRIAREATALAAGTYKLWNTRAPDILRKAADKLEREERERRA